MSDSEPASVSSSPSPTKSPKLNLSLDLRFISIALLLVIIVMVALWRPWTPRTAAAARTISVTGTATVKSEPDEFVFYPSYEFDNASKSTAIAALTAKQNDVVTGLKKLGVTDKQIKADSNGYQNYYYDDTAGTYNYTLSLTVTIDNAALSQKVQDYLVSTDPSGSISPAADFSDAKQKTLESQGRDAATKDARSKAEQSATNLGFKIGAVKSVDDSGSQGIVPGCNGGLCMGANAVASTDAKSSLTVQAGQNDLTYTVTVVYYLK